MPTKRVKKAVAIKQGKPVAVRLELLPVPYKKLGEQAEKKGLSRAALARMIILEWLEEQDAPK